MGYGTILNGLDHLPAPYPWSLAMGEINAGGERTVAGD
jgi:hypothetical protein